MEITTNEKLRLARMENICESVRRDMDDVLEKNYKKAVEENDEEKAAFFLRKIRNKMLEESDKEILLDRIAGDVPESDSVLDWIPWLRKIASTKSNEWGEYRKNLRDLTEQEGFPFSVVFPKKPNKNKTDEENSWLEEL